MIQIILSLQGADKFVVIIVIDVDSRKDSGSAIGE